jgi:hypothetical protein
MVVVYRYISRLSTLKIFSLVEEQSTVTTDYHLESDLSFNSTVR